MVQGQTVTAFDPKSKASQALVNVWEKVIDLLIGKS